MKNRYGIAIGLLAILQSGIYFADSIPMMSRVYGDQFTTQTAVTQNAGVIGQLVPTGIFGTNGTLSLAGQVPNSQATAVTVLNNGIIAVAFGNGTNTYLVEYTQEGTVYSGFAAGTGNILTIAGKPNNISTILVDKQQRFLLAGMTSSSPWITRVTTTGTIDGTFNFTDGASWTSAGSIGAISNQTSGEIIAVGSNGTHGMIARYLLNGTIDTTFGSSGYVTFNGSSSYPTTTIPLQNVVIDSSNNLYVAYLDATPSVNVIRLTANGEVDTSWNGGVPVNIAFLTGSNMQTNQLRMVLDALGDLVVAIPSGTPTVIHAASITSATGAVGTFANFTTSGGVFGTDNYLLNNMFASSDNNVYFVGSDLTSQSLMIICTTTAGVLNQDFNPNGTQGVNFFYPAGFEPSVYAQVNCGALAPTGLIFLAEAQLDSGITTPFLSCLYGTQYVTQISQYAQVQEQGTSDYAFGQVTNETDSGIVNPYVGLYRDQLLQQANYVVELASGNLLIGQDGYTDTSTQVSMMLIRLTPDGAYDVTFGASSGELVLPNLTSTDEFITSIVEDANGNLYITGYSGLGAIFRKYSANGILIWNADFLETGFQGHSCSFEGTTRVLLFLSGPLNIGQINAYTLTDGILDPSFYNSGTVPGILNSTAYGLNIGSLYSGIVDTLGNFYIAYKNTATGAIDAAGLFNAATGVIWHIENIFSTTAMSSSNIRVTFNQDKNIVIAGALTTSFHITVLQYTNGQPAPNYSSPLLISCGTNINVTQTIGVSNDTIMVVGYDSGTANTMIVLRINASGALDTTFNSQGPTPGIVFLQPDTELASYYSRIASSILIQSTAGANQGNIIMTGYEQMFSSQSTPLALRLFGTPGTTQVKTSPVVVTIPGTLDITYNSSGIADTYVLGASSPTANQEVRAIRQIPGTQIMTIVTDNNTAISYTQLLNSDSSINTTYSPGGVGIAIEQLSGTETVQNMVFDCSYNMLVTGSNSTYGGYIKRLLIDGSMDQTFGNFNYSASSAPVLLGASYGLMDVINGCQQLTNGNIVIVGSKNNQGVIQMLTSAGALLLSFAGNVGQVLVGNSVNSVSVDSNNDIYATVAYTDTPGHYNAEILKLNINGLPITSYGTNGFITSALSGIDTTQTLRGAFDNSYRMVVAGSYGGLSGQVLVNRFNTDGSVDATFNGGSELPISLYVPGNIVVTGIAPLADNKILISGYQYDLSDDANNYEFIISVAADGTQDGGFGTQSNPGVVTFQGSNTTQLLRRLVNMNVQADGQILLCGGEIPAVNEETPLTFRFNGYPNVQAVPQFTGYQPGLPNELNIYFNQNGAIPGVDQGPTLALLTDGGYVGTDSTGRGLVGGVLTTGSNGVFVVNRFLKNGLLDTVENGGTGFGTNGVAQSTTAIRGLSRGRIAIDGSDNIYVAGYAGTNQLVVARFNSSGVLDTAYGTAGTATSPVISHLVGGGYITIDANNKVLLGGYTANNQLVVVRLLLNGNVDPSFASSTGNIAAATVGSLQSGGSLAVDFTNGNIFIAGRTATGSANKMVVAQFLLTGVINTAYGTSGYAYTPSISTLSQGCDLALDSVGRVIVGGLTTNQEFVASRFTVLGDLDTNYNASGLVPGITYSLPVDILDVFGGIAIDLNGAAILGGTALTYGQQNALIVARFNALGELDTTFSSNGMSTSDAIPNLSVGGSVIADIYNNVFIGALTTDPALMIAQMYSGQQVIVTNPLALTPEDLRVYYYGDSYEFLIDVFQSAYSINTTVSSSNTALRIAIANAVQTIVNNYYNSYSGKTPFSLIWNFNLTLNQFTAAKAILLNTFTNSSDQESINQCFTSFETRINGMQVSSDSSGGIV